MHDFDFDKEFNRTRKLAVGAFIFNGILGLGILGLVIWVAVHFLKKLW